MSNKRRGKIKRNKALNTHLSGRGGGELPELNENKMATYNFSTVADKQAAIAAQVASTSEVQSVHDQHLQDLKNATVNGTVNGQANQE